MLEQAIWIFCPNFKQLPDLAEDQIREMEALPESQMNELLAA